MKGIWKIVRIILVFFLSLAVIALAWYAIEMSSLQPGESAIPFIDFVLYLLGFGDLTLEDHYLQAVFSTLGLFAVTLLSSVFTVNLFELRSKVRIGSHLIIKSKRSAKVELRSAGRDIYDLTAKLICKCGRDVTAEEQQFPFVAKKSSQELTFEIVPGSVIYKYLRAEYLDPACEPQLILTVTYTDIETGQEYTMAKKYQYTCDRKSQILFDQTHSPELEAAVRQNVESGTFYINLASVVPCNAEDIDLTYGDKSAPQKLSQKQAFRAAVHMDSHKTYVPGDFTMAVTKDLLGNDWTTYYDLGCALKFSYKVEGDMAVTMELKSGAANRIIKTKKLRGSDEFADCVLDLRSFSREDLEQVSELCFTVFYKDVDPRDPTGSFTIRNCMLQVEG